MTKQALIHEVAEARERFISSVAGMNREQANFKPNPDVWSATENTEHMVLAEEGGVSGMWKALDGLKNGQPVWSGEPIHRGASIEEVVANTWQPKEKVPDIAAPKWGGAIDYWIASLRARQGVLEGLGDELGETDLEGVIYPHPISGPLDVRQRLEFLRFHLERHRQQVEALKQYPEFPA